MLPLTLISKRFGNEHALLLLICRVHVGTATVGEINDFISHNLFDWDKVFLNIQKQKIFPVAYDVLVNTIADNKFKHRIKKEIIVLNILSEEQEKEMLRLYKLLRAKAINIIPYKGIGFARQYYGNTLLRQSTDIDFLMAENSYEDLQQIIDTLTEEGYKPVYNIPYNYRELLFKNTCEFYFDKYRNGIRSQHIEFHWVAHHPIFDLPVSIPNNILFQNTEMITISNHDIEVLNTENNLLAILLHHGVRENWSSLKHILDVAMLISSSNVKWKDLRAICVKYRIEKALDLGLALSKDLLGIQKVQLSSKKVNADWFIANIFSDKKQSQFLAYHQWQKIKILDNRSARLKMIQKQLLYIFSPSLLDFKLIALPKPLHFLYFFVKIHRIFIGLSRQKT